MSIDLIDSLKARRKSIEHMHRTMSRLSEPRDHVVIVRLTDTIEEGRTMIQQDLHELRLLDPTMADKMTEAFLNDHILDQVQAGRDHQDSVFREERRKVPFYKWGKSTQKVAPMGRLKRKRRFTRGKKRRKL